MPEALFLLISLSFTMMAMALPNHQIHHTMSADDIRSIFHVDSHDLVPEYDVIRIRSRIKRSISGGAEGGGRGGEGGGGEEENYTRRVHLRAFENDHILNLRPNFDLARSVPLFYADDDGSGHVRVTKTSYEPDVGIPHQDEEAMAAVLVHHNPLTGSFEMDGSIGDDLIVRSLPHNLLPAAMESVAESGKEEEQSLNDLPPDDEFFMDDMENLEDEMIFGDSFPLVDDGVDNNVLGEAIVGVNEGMNIFGDISSNFTQQQLPEGLTLLRRRRSLESEGFHIVYRRRTPVIDTDYAMMEPGHIPTRSNPDARKRRKRNAPYIIYPEILVLVDYDGYLLHGQENTRIKSYYVSFWNGVDLRYKLLKGPKVKVSIAGIIISRSRDAMPYLERNRVGRDAIDSASALTDMGKYLYKERRLPTYDIAVAITKLDMCRRAFTGGVCNRGTAGFAYVGGACVVNKRLQKVNSVAIVEDTGGFSGIIVAAHEVGHLLGSVHDGSPPPSYLGGPGARRCRWEDGYIMSDLRHTEKGFRWSSCSTEQFRHFLNGDTATCLYNLPHEDESLLRVLPGKLLSLDEQCRKDRGTSACFKDDRVCAQLFCFDASSGYCVSYRPAAEGSDCGSGQICRNGRCVHDNENTITDYQDINRSGDPLLFQSTQVKPVYTDPPESTTSPPSSETTSSWNRWHWNRRTTTPRKFTPRTTTPTTKTTPTTTTPTTTKRTTKKRTTTTTTTTTTTPTTTPTTTTKNPKTTFKTTTTRSPTKDIKKTYKDQLKTNDADCEDRITSIAGSLTCAEFLRSYGSRYCGHRYIQKNCCHSQKELCHGR